MDELVVINRNSKCNFCKLSKNDHFRYGPIYKLGNIKAHYYCVLLSKKLIQNGNDNEGLLGFLLSDIQKELQRTLNIFCAYCKKGNATILCAAKKCRKSFHLPCGLKNGSLHQFTDQFQSFCNVHRPIQKIPEKILKDASKANTICCICYDKVNVRDKKDTLWAPCCLKTWYHRYCAQKLAHSEGYFFRCAICNNDQKFIAWMERFGIFIPKQDASWELVPNAYQELLFKYNKCDAEKCKCPEGRQKNTENTMWEIVLCESCGSQGMHVACGNLKFVDPEWECPSCQMITNRMKSAIKIDDSFKADEGSSEFLKLTEVCQKKRRRSSEDLENSVLDKRKKCRNNREEKEEEHEIDVEIIDEEPKEKTDAVAEVFDKAKVVIDVEIEEAKPSQKSDLQEVLTQLKPGPLSYKLSIIENFCGNSLMRPDKPSEGYDAKTISSGIDIIVLRDSDAENETNDDDEMLWNSTKQEEMEDSTVKISVNQKEFSDEIENRSERPNEVDDGPKKFTFALKEFDVICDFKLQPVERKDDEIIKLPPPVQMADDKIRKTNQQSAFSSPVKLLHLSSGQGIFKADLRLSETGIMKKKKTVKSLEDEVIILSD